MLVGTSARAAHGLRSALPKRAFSTLRAGGIPVAAHDENRASVNLSVAIQAGARYQNSPGAASALRAWLFQANDARSALATVRETELRGGVISSSVGKDHILLNLQFLKNDAPFFVQLVADALTSPKLHPWEFTESVVPTVTTEADNAAHNAVIAGLEALTRAAYHGQGPGQAILASPASPLGYETARQYANSSLLSDKVALAATGLNVNKLASLVESSFAKLNPGFPASDKQEPPVKYFGDHARVPLATHGEPDHVFLAFNAAGIDPAALTVLASLLGGKSHLKWSSGQSALSKVAATIEGAQAQALHLPYEGGAGLFGLHVASPSKSAQRALQASVEALKSIASGSTDAVNAAVAQAKYALAATYESNEASELASAQLLSGKNAATVEEALAALEVSPSAVSEAAAKLLSTAPSSAAVGNVAELPYPEDVL